MEATMVQSVDLSKVDAILKQRKWEKGALISILQQTQDAYGYLPREVLSRIADTLDIPFSQVYGVATFYSQFYLKPRGRNIIKVCDGTACHVSGADKTVLKLKEELGVESGEPTPDLEFTYEVVYCLGSCALAPLVIVNDEIMGRCSSEKMHKLIEDARAAK